jgi:mannose/cellobiose epimerase-like protein (N-acyl-D-glucosamine 2-epimerase family)
MDPRLTEVAERGQPAHAAEAARLIERLAADPDDAQARAAAAALVDAYLNDPYLIR